LRLVFPRRSIPLVDFRTSFSTALSAVFLVTVGAHSFCVLCTLALVHDCISLSDSISDGSRLLPFLQLGLYNRERLQSSSTCHVAWPHSSPPPLPHRGTFPLTLSPETPPPIPLTRTSPSPKPPPAEGPFPLLSCPISSPPPRPGPSTRLLAPEAPCSGSCGKRASSAMARARRASRSILAVNSSNCASSAAIASGGKPPVHFFQMSVT
jgi:hypothetical protein